MAHIHSICYTPKDAPRQAESPDSYVRLPLEAAMLVAGRGIDGDRKGSHPDRQLNIMSLEVMETLSTQGLKVQPGAMGEQIVISGFDVADLNPGDRVQFGESAVIEMAELRNGCGRFEHIQQTDPKTLKRKLGIMARVVVGGAIRVGDPVRVVTYARD